MSDFLSFAAFITLLAAQISAVVAAHRVRVSKTSPELETAQRSHTSADDVRVQHTLLSG